MPTVDLNKYSSEEFFIAAREMTNEFIHKVVKDQSCKSKPVMSLFRMTAGWIPQPTDNVAITKSGDPSIKNWGIQHLVQTSCEALGIEKEKLQNTTIICPITGDEIYPTITMNGIILDTNNLEFIHRTCRYGCSVSM